MMMIRKNGHFVFALQNPLEGSMNFYGLTLITTVSRWSTKLSTTHVITDVFILQEQKGTYTKTQQRIRNPQLYKMFS